jgi:hypothetical protein
MNKRPLSQTNNDGYSSVAERYSNEGDRYGMIFYTELALFTIESRIPWLSPYSDSARLSRSRCGSHPTTDRDIPD